MINDQNEGIKEQTKPLSISWNDHKELKIVKDALMKRYELLDYLGGGGFGKVFKLKDKKLGRECALKVLKIDKLDESSDKAREEKKARFIKEAKLYAKCSHPNIAPIFDIGGEDTFPYFIMEYIKGASLESTISKKGKLSLTDVLKISEGILSAFECIHRQGLVHRDIKPANVMIEKESGRSIIIDFGIAKDLTSSSTVGGTGLGTPIYMAPEQFSDSSKVTPKTDIYSLGVVVYEMLAGEVPFNGKNYGEVMLGHLDKPVPNIREKNLDLPVGIEDIIIKAMAKDPKDRYEDSGDFLNAFRKFNDMQKWIGKEKKYPNAKGMEFIKIEPNANENTPIINLADAVKKEPKEKIEEKIKIKPDGKLPPQLPKIEDGKKSKTPEIKRVPKRKFKIKYLIYIGIIIAVIAAFIFLKSSIPKWLYDGYISSANNFIESNDWEKASKALNKAKQIKKTEEIERLFAKIKRKRIEGMKRDWDYLKAFLKEKSSNKDKLQKCREFLAKHEGVPGNGEKTAIFSEVNPYISKLDAEVKLDEEYQTLLKAATEFIKKEDYPKAIETLEKARTNRGTDTEEIATLSKEIEEKQIAAMINDFETLKKFLAGGATEKEKIEKCRAVLESHPNTTGNKAIQAIRDEIGRVISSLNDDIKSNEQYQKYIDAVNNLINNKDYEGAEKELNKARKIKDSDEVKRLSVIITEGIEKERTNGEKDFKSIKDRLTLSRFRAFQRNYPQSAHLQELRDRLNSADKNLPPDKYWDKPIRKNGKGYYEITFGKEHNGHQMIYIPGKKIWIDKYEVSWAQFRKYLKDEKRPIPSKESNEYINDGDGFPAVVTFGEAESYCKRYGFQLPKKAEWEYAAGKGSLIYPWGSESPGVPNAGGQWRANLDTLDGDKDKDGYKGTASVKSFEPFSSPFGVVNMAGNVWEWIQGKVLKGGGYLSLEDDLRIGNVRQPEPLDKEGFRCIKVEN